MNFFFLYYILQIFLGNPVLVIFILVIIYALVDRRFIGILPDFLQPWRRWQKISRLKREIEFYPLEGRNLYELGAELVENGSMKQGRQYLEKARALMPEHPDVLYYLGVAYMRTGMEQAGNLVLEKAIQINPKVKYGAPYLYLLEYTLKNEASAEKAEGYEKKVVEYASPEYYYKLGRIFAAVGQKEKAAHMYREAIINFRDYPSFYKKTHRTWAFRAWLRGFI